MMCLICACLSFACAYFEVVPFFKISELMAQGCIERLFIAFEIKVVFGLFGRLATKEAFT